MQYANPIPAGNAGNLSPITSSDAPIARQVRRPRARRFEIGGIKGSLASPNCFVILQTDWPALAAVLGEIDLTPREFDDDMIGQLIRECDAARVVAWVYPNDNRTYVTAIWPNWRRLATELRRQSASALPEIVKPEGDSDEPAK